MCFSTYWILIHISVLLAVSLESSVKPDMKNMKLIHVLCQVHSCCLCYQTQEHMLTFRQSNPFAPTLCPLGNLNALCKHCTKKLLRIQVNKQVKSQIHVQSCLFKGPHHKYTRGPQHHSASSQKKRSFWNYGPRNDGSHSTFWFKMGRAEVLAVVRTLVLIFITSWERVSVGVVKQSFIPITPGETLLK